MRTRGGPYRAAIRAGQSPSPSHARATPPRVPPPELKPSPGRVARAACRDTRSAHLVISSRAASARSVFLPRWWLFSLADYRRRQGLPSSPAPRRPSRARSLAHPATQLFTASSRLSSVDLSRTVAPPSAPLRSCSPPSPPTVDRSQQQQPFSTDCTVVQAPGLLASVS